MANGPPGPWNYYLGVWGGLGVFGDLGAMFGVLFWACCDVEHNVSMVRVRVKFTDMPITDQIHTRLIRNCQVNNGVVAAAVEERWVLTPI